MKILLIEDNQSHIDAAIAQLVGHELTIYKSWKEFMGFPEDLSGYPKLIRDYEMHIEVMKGYDMVLTDINIPGILDTDKSQPEAPIGLSIILRAAEAGVKYIGSITDKGHHGDALTKTFDMWCYHQKPFQIGDSKVMIKDDFIKWEGENRLKDWKKMCDFLTQE